MNRFISTVSSVMVLLIAANVVQVQALDAAAFKVGGFSLAPTLGVDVQDDDNIFTSTTGTSSTITTVTPGIRAQADFGHTDLGITYTHAAGRFSSSRDDDFDDDNLSADLSWELNARNQFDIEAALNKGHDPRGSEGSANVAVPDEFDEELLRLKYTYGSDTSKGRLELEVGSFDKEFTNNRTSTFDNDREDSDVGATFYFKVAPRTDVLLEVKSTNTDYDSAIVTLDSDVETYNIGVSWAATGKTKGTVKVGQTKKDFDSLVRADATLDSWDAEIVFSPKSYSIITLSTDREPRETSSIGNFIDAKSYNLNWTHGWNQRLTSNIFTEYTEEVYDASGREDETSVYGFRLDYHLKRWVDVGFSANYKDVESTDSVSVYDRTQIAFHLLMGL